MGVITMKDRYTETHIGTYRYQCNKNTEYGFSLVRQNGKYESLASFKDLPSFMKLKKNGRKWIHTKTYAPIMDRIVLDIDSEDLEKAFKVTKSLMQEFQDYQDNINIYFSGSKGFHLEILTDELDIIDTTADKPMNSCIKYAEFLNYFNNEFNEVDESLKDIGTRVFRKHHTKHEKTGNYKILIDVNASLDEILAHSKKNKDMLNPKTAIMDKDTALLLLNTYSKPLEIETKETTKKVTFDDLMSDIEYREQVDDSIYPIIFNELKCNLHHRIGLLGSALNGYVNAKELETIYNILCKTTDIEQSDNAKGSFIDAYNDDNIPCNMGGLLNEYKNENLDLSNFYKLSDYLKSKIENKNYEAFNILFEKYNYDWFNMLESELYDYVNNTSNIFKGIINSLSALYGYGSRFVVINGGAEVGKSEYINTIKKLMPKFKNLGSSTPASIRRANEHEFNKKIAYIGDKGLKGKSQASKDEFEGIYEVFGGLITDKEFIRDVIDGGQKTECRLKSDGICVFYTEPYTNLRVYGAGDQYTTRSTFITINPVEDGLSVFLEDETAINGFYNIHKNYIRQILKNPIKLKISDEVKTKIYYASRESLRTAKYLLGLFKAYCQYLQLGNPLTTDVEDFLNVFKPQFEISQIEFLVYEKLYNNLNVLKSDDLEYKIADDGGILYKDMLNQIKDRKSKSFFTVQQFKTYFKSDFKRNKNLKDTIDQMADILHNLYNAGLIEKIEYHYNNQEVYYIPYNIEMSN
jgi:hypothetical protein